MAAMWAGLAACLLSLASATTMYEYGAPVRLASLSSYARLAVSSWRVPADTALANWVLQPATRPGCPPVNLTM